MLLIDKIYTKIAKISNLCIASKSEIESLRKLNEKLTTIVEMQETQLNTIHKLLKDIEQELDDADGVQLPLKEIDEIPHNAT